MSTAFLFPGLNALKRRKDRVRFLSNPGVCEQLHKSSVFLRERYGLKVDALAFLAQPEERLYNNDNLAITAVFNTSIQVAISQQLKYILTAPVCVMGYSQGDIARSVYANMIDMEQAIEYIYEFFQAVNIDLAYGENIGIRTQKPNAFTAEDIQWFSAIDVQVSRFTPHYLICSVEPHQLALIRKQAQQKNWQIKQSVFKYPVHSKLLQPAIEHILTGSVSQMINFKSPALPVYSSILNKPIYKINELIQETRIGLYSPVNWLQAVYAIVDKYQVSTIVNIGPCRSISLLMRETPIKLKVIESDKLLADI